MLCKSHFPIFRFHCCHVFALHRLCSRRASENIDSHTDVPDVERWLGKAHIPWLLGEMCMSIVLEGRWIQIVILLHAQLGYSRWLQPITLIYDTYVEQHVMTGSIPLPLHSHLCGTCSCVAPGCQADLTAAADNDNDHLPLPVEPAQEASKVAIVSQRDTHTACGLDEDPLVVRQSPRGRGVFERQADHILARRQVEGLGIPLLH